MTQEVQAKRVKTPYESRNERFLLECDFSKQYASYYRKRLEKTQPYLEFNCRAKWDPSIPLYTLSQLAFAPTADFQCDESGRAIIPTPTPETPQSPLSPQSPPSFGEQSKRLRRFSEDSNNAIPTTSSPIIRSSTQQRNLIKSPDQLQLFRSPIIAPSTSRDDKCRVISTPTPDHNSTLYRQECEPTPQCIIIGTIFKRMRLQPDIIDEISKGDFHIKCERYLGHYTSKDDRLVLEDKDESISLVGDIDAGKFVTGVVVALLGVPLEDCSSFYVHDICYAEANRQLIADMSQMFTSPKIETPLGVNGQSAVYLLVVSGLGFSHDLEPNSTLTKALQNMIDFIWGGGKYSDDAKSSLVTRILVVGDNLNDSRLAAETEGSNSNRKDWASKMKETRQVKPYASSVQAIKHMDNFFVQLSKTIFVDVMPGPSDPSSHLMPQQPFHPCMFPKSCVFSTFNCTTNPHHAKYNDVEILATAGQNIDIISKFSNITEPLDVMKHHLMWGNCAPSAPDNLYSAPYEDDDPYVLDFIPEIYIAGCQEYYQTEWFEYSNKLSQNTTLQVNSQSLHASTSKADDTLVQEPDSLFKAGITKAEPRLKTPSPVPTSRQEPVETKPRQMPQFKDRTLLLTVPKFCETLSCVLIDLRTLDTSLISFK